ncbi:hypothetical protein FDECE_12263 [Fusarium decemcellulare]|nr:hypothetical protein FDECE_12263 [Fusarium decemcellulare]
MPQNFHFRIATVDDAGRLQDLIQAAFRVTNDDNIDWIGSSEFANAFNIELDLIISRITAPHGKFLVLNETETNRIIGCVNVFRMTPDFGRLGLLAVDPSLHRGGLGRILLTHGEKYLTQELGVRKIGLNTLHTRKDMIKWFGPDVCAKIVLIEFEKNVA